MKSLINVAGRAANQVTRGFSSSNTYAQQLEGLFNLVIRDHNQGAFRNGQDVTDEKSLEIMTHFDELNQHGKDGAKYFGYLEGGGQEPGSHVMNFRDIKDLYSKSVKAMPNGTEIRSLTRGAYGNSVVALSQNDSEEWLEFVHKSTNGRVAFKIFDYNTNIDEFSHCAETVKKLGAKIEIAVPHSPEKEYQPFFEKKFAEAAQFASNYGADLSVKRMVAGLSVEESREIGNAVFPLAKQHGVNKVGLHAHGDVPAAVAEFAKIGVDHGIQVNLDFVHDKSGPTPDAPGTFPSVYKIIEELKVRDVNVDLSEKQLEILAKIDQLQQERDQSYKAIRVGGTWSDDQKVAMGLPDGGESYSVEAIRGSSYFKDLGKKFGEEKAFDIAKDVFEVSYKEFRERFGMPTGVTPGHKRIETGSIHSAGKIIDSILNDCVEAGVLDQEKFTKVIKSKSYDDLYAGLNADIIDAFRNNKLPQKLTDASVKFLCEEHMRNTLKQPAFKDLEDQIKENLVNVSNDSEAVRRISQEQVDKNLLPQDVLANKGENFSKVSLVQASGKREYLEGDKAPERYQACYNRIVSNMEEGGKVSNPKMAAVIASALTAGETVYVDGSYPSGKFPTAAGKTSEEYKGQCAKFYAEMHIDVVKSAGKAKKLFTLPSSGELMKFGADGDLSGHVEQSVMGNVKPDSIFKATQNSNLTDNDKENGR